MGVMERHELPLVERVESCGRGPHDDGHTRGRELAGTRVFTSSSMKPCPTDRSTERLRVWMMPSSQTAPDNLGPSTRSPSAVASTINCTLRERGTRVGLAFMQERYRARSGARQRTSFRSTWPLGSGTAASDVADAA
jgi:hypothetical protein